MYSFFNGIVRSINKSNIILEVNNIGYNIIVGKTQQYNINDIKLIQTYLIVKEDSLLLYGFEDKDKYELFIKLISVKGIGPKTALMIVTEYNTVLTIKAIIMKNIDYLKKLPGIGIKSAQQLILDLSNKLIICNNDNDDVMLINTMKSLGFSMKEINKALPKVEVSLNKDQKVKELLKLIKK